MKKSLSFKPFFNIEISNNKSYIGISVTPHCLHKRYKMQMSIDFHDWRNTLLPKKSPKYLRSKVTLPWTNKFLKTNTFFLFFLDFTHDQAMIGSGSRISVGEGTNPPAGGGQHTILPIFLKTA